MKFASTSLIVAAAALASINLASASSAAPRSNKALQHRGLAQKMRRAVGLAKRGSYSGTATWYGAGVSEGACGGWHSASDFIVALNTQLYGNENAQSSWCGKSLVITGGGVTQTATVVDACPSCPSSGDLDMSTGLFQSFGKSLGVGEFDITWHVAGSGGSSSGNNDHNDQKPSTTTHHHTSTHTPTHTHTPTSTKTTESSTKQSTSTSTSTSSSSTSSSSSVAPTSTGAVAGDDSSSTTTSTQSNPQNLQGMSELIQGFINIANAGH